MQNLAVQSKAHGSLEIAHPGYQMNEVLNSSIFCPEKTAESLCELRGYFLCPT
jgi:hypothetical protein